MIILVFQLKHDIISAQNNFDVFFKSENTNQNLRITYMTSKFWRKKPSTVLKIIKLSKLNILTTLVLNKTLIVCNLHLNKYHNLKTTFSIFPLSK